MGRGDACALPLLPCKGWSCFKAWDQISPFLGAVLSDINTASLQTYSYVHGAQRGLKWDQSEISLFKLDIYVARSSQSPCTCSCLAAGMDLSATAFSRLPDNRTGAVLNTSALPSPAREQEPSRAGCRGVWNNDCISEHSSRCLDAGKKK